MTLTNHLPASGKGGKDMENWEEDETTFLFLLTDLHLSSPGDGLLSAPNPGDHPF